MDSSLAVTRRRSFSHSHSDRSLAVTRLVLLQLLDSRHRSLSCGYPSRITLSQLLGADRSLAVAWINLSHSLGSISRSHSTRSLAVTRHGSLSCGYSTRIALLRLLIMDSSLAVTRIACNLSIDTSSMTTCSGGSEHCPHRSFAQPSRSKKSDRNQKYVDDSSPETVSL
ncbi:hypothetical protein F2Q69_00001309 [Brassica cretica]|uniref:Uncharacterized protein n=1 Tax=Brassica cretica TaxID=69181 RepID=A0A8S9P236_BRACR|nr:hypothetical protein F2Q69_00001309 [Brassica cretica]